MRFPIRSSARVGVGGSDTCNEPTTASHRDRGGRDTHPPPSPVRRPQEAGQTGRAPQYPTSPSEAGEDAAEAALEGDDAAVHGNQLRSFRVAVLRVPDGDAVNLLNGTRRSHARGGADLSIVRPDLSFH